jgi:pyrroline-5-carboxylate reductase
MTSSFPKNLKIAFIGGGNMASALIGGLLKAGTSASQVHVLEPDEGARARLESNYAVTTWASAGIFLDDCSLIVWAIKPQIFKEVASSLAKHCAKQLHLSVAAGVTTSSIQSWIANSRIVRAMPNTPALIGQGQTGLFATSSVSVADQVLIAQIFEPTGQFIWVDQENQLDAVTALSGSGPAYVFYFIEALMQAGQDMGLSQADAKQLAIGTFMGASSLALQSDESPSVLRERVTSKGGTTYAALEHMRSTQVGEHIKAALLAAQHRAKELGEEFGR